MKKRTAKLGVDPADISVDEHGNVVIKDAALASEVVKLKGAKGGVWSDICCSGCGCSDTKC